MSRYHLISADSHVLEPPDLWEKRLPAKFVERAPKLVRDSAGGDAWVYGDSATPEPLGLTATAGKRYEDFSWTGNSYQNIVQGAYRPHERIKEMDADGVDAEILYQPQRTMTYFLTCGDDELQLAGIQAYNNWLHDEFASVAPARLIGIAQMPNLGVDGMVAEMQRAIQKGMRGVVISTWPNGGNRLEPEDDVFWAAAEDAGIPVSIHVSLVNETRMKVAGGNWRLPGSAAKGMTSMPAIMGDMILDGLFDRFPKLQIIMVETGTGWIPYFLEQLDDRYWRNRHWTNCTIQRIPSEYYQTNWSATFILDRYGLANRHAIGLRTMLWSTDYPHQGNDWPYSRRVLKDMAAGIPDEEMRLIVAGNVARLYRLDD